MGFKYPTKNEQIPIPEKQRRLDPFWMEDILTSIAFNFEILGRTMILLSRGDALCLNTSIVDSTNHKVVRARIYDDIMLGTHGKRLVAAGRRIEFLEQK